MNENLDFIGINTDRDISTILSNFSTEYISDYMYNALTKYKFRPFNTRMPNFPYILEQNFIGIKDNYSGEQFELIEQTRLKTYQNIIEIICEQYNLVITTDIPDEFLYSVAYILYQIFVSEFSDNLIGFFIRYLTSNKESLINALTDEQRAIKSTYSKKAYNQQNDIIVYENIDNILDIIATLDIDLRTYLLFTGGESAAMIANYISDTTDIYKNHLASYIKHPDTRIDMITSIKIRFIGEISGNNNIINNGGTQFFI